MVVQWLGGILDRGFNPRLAQTFQTKYKHTSLTRKG